MKSPKIALESGFSPEILEKVEGKKDNFKIRAVSQKKVTFQMEDPEAKNGLFQKTEIFGTNGSKMAIL